MLDGYGARARRLTARIAANKTRKLRSMIGDVAIFSGMDASEIKELFTPPPPGPVMDSPEPVAIDLEAARKAEDAEFWKAVYCVVAGSVGCKYGSTAAEWADSAVKRFRERY